jgi:hypothetical protein
MGVYYWLTDDDEDWAEHLWYEASKVLADAKLAGLA